MSIEELKKVQVIKQVMGKGLRWREAAEILGKSVRQVGRLVKKMRLYGERGILHGLRGKSSNRKIEVCKKGKVLKLYKEKYKDFGPRLAGEKLYEIDKIKLSEETLRKWLIADEGIECSWRRKGRKHRKWRERKGHCGELVQMDGSEHDWFEGRGEKCVLVGYIDDATSRVYARFYEFEGTIPAMGSFKRYIRKYGIPENLYTDKHTAYHSRDKLTVEEELEGKNKSETQFERAVKELGVNIMVAHSPQAKGRIERLFKTFQDRLIKEMRLRGISSIEGANKFLEYYLPIYNKRFSVIAREKSDLHRPLAKGINLDRILCIKTRHALRNDFTVIHNKNMYQVEDDTRVKNVITEERIDGTMKIYAGDISLKYHKIEYLPVKNTEVRKESDYLISLPKKKYIPPKNHPWRKFIINPYRSKVNQRVDIKP